MHFWHCHLLEISCLWLFGIKLISSFYSRFYPRLSLNLEKHFLCRNERRLIGFLNCSSFCKRKGTFFVEEPLSEMGVSKVIVYPDALRDGRPISDVYESLIQYLRDSFAHVDSSPFSLTVRSFSVSDGKPSEVVKEFFLVHFDPPSPSPSPSPSTASTSLKCVDYFALEEVPLRTHGVLYSSVPSPQRLYYSVVSGDEPMESLLLSTKMFSPARLHHIQHIEVALELIFKLFGSSL